jgi:hypothetical protein
MRHHAEFARRLVILALVFCAGLSAARAQEITGSLNGTVKDASGAAVKGATVTVTDQGSKVAVRTVTTNDEGDFSIPSLPVATYTVTTEAPSFKKSVQTDVKLDVNQRRTLDLTLEAGNITESVTVEANPVTVELTTPTASTTINGSQVRELSINNRNWVSLIALAPGVTQDLDDLLFTGTQNPETQVVNRMLISVNGARSTQNTFTVDGADITDRGSNLTIQAYPSVDSIGEFQVLRSLYPAESGRSGGGQINIVTRSGQDKFHGGGFEFIRNEALNANDFQTNRTPSLASTLGIDPSTGKIKRRPFRYNNFGGTFGGPVYVPNFGEGNGRPFSKLARTFFFFSQENRIDRTFPLLGPATVPDALLKQGIFPVPICLRATTTCQSILPAGTPIGSVVPLSSVAQQYVNGIWSHVPNPNNVAAYQLSFPALNVAKFNQQIIKVDHTFTNKWSAYYRYEHDKIPTNDADGTIGTRSGLPFVNTTTSNSPGKTHTFQTTYSINPKMILEGRYTYGYGAIFISTTGLLGRNVTPISVPLAYPNTRDIDPIIGVAGFNTLTGFGNYIDPSSKQNIGGSFTWIAGNHTMKYGSSYSNYTKMENALGGTAQGQFNTFNNSTTSGSVLANPATSFNTAQNRMFQSWANFLQGNLTTFTQNKFDLTANLRQKAIESFAQDEWRFRKNLTLYYGVRYSYFGAPWDKNGLLTNFVPSLYNASAAPQVTGNATRVNTAGSNFCNGLIVNSQNATAASGNFVNCTPTVSPWGKYVYDVSKHDFAPRVGLAWDPFGKGRTAIRTGYGMYHEQIPISAIELFLGQNPPFQETVSIANTSLDQPIPAGQTAAGVASLTVQSLRGIQSNFKTPYMQHWSLDLQQQFGHKTVVTVGYYGSRGTHLIGFTELNDLPPGLALNSRCATGANTLQNPGSGGTVPCLAAGSALFSGTAANTAIDQIRPYRGYRSIDMLETRYNSNYHSLQVSAQRRFTGASQANLSYTWSHNLTDNQTSSNNASPQDTYNIHNDYGPATLDRRHVLTANYIYELPFFRKQEGFLGKTLGGWQASGIFTHYTGLPFTSTTSSYDPAGLGFINSIPTGGRPNLLCDPNANAPHTVTQWFNTQCFSLNPPTTTTTGIANVPGTSPRGIVIGPPTTRVDFTMSKNIRFGESKRVQLRAESFNVLNHTNFRALSTNVTSSTFGQVTSFRDPRVIQLGVKFEF